MNENDIKVDNETILNYDPEAIKRNIRKHKENILVFNEEIKNAEESIEKLEGYLMQIEEHRRISLDIARKAEQSK